MSVLDKVIAAVTPPVAWVLRHSDGKGGRAR